MLVRDGVSIFDRTGTFRFRTHVGAIFPRTDAADDPMEVHVAVAGPDRKASAVPALLAKADAAAIPLALTPRNVATLANRMLGQPYGWGGLHENRDCSATTRDLFIPFGLWLPRDSADQAKAGTVIPLASLPGAEKERVILERGVPFLSLVRSAGHIMLYVGRHDGRALVLHNTWGIRVRDRAGGPDAPDGRVMLGRCAITTLQPGIEMPDLVLPQGDLRNRVESLVLLAPAGAK